MSEPLWFYSKEDRSIGPVPESKLREELAAGGLPPDTLVWCEGMSDWMSASKAPQLQPRAVATPPPLPAPPPLPKRDASLPPSSPSELRLKKRMATTVPPPLPARAKADASPSEPLPKEPTPEEILGTKPKKIGLKAVEPSATPYQPPPIHATTPEGSPTVPTGIYAPHVSKVSFGYDRPWWITLICVLGFLGVGLTFLALALPFVRDLLANLYGEAAIGFLLFLNVAYLVAFSGIWNMKRWGVYVFCAVTLVEYAYFLVQGIAIPKSGMIHDAVFTLVLLYSLRDME